MGYRTFVLDGDNVRPGLCGDPGFSIENRRENIRRIGEMSKLLVEAGVIVFTIFISPLRANRQKARHLLPPATSSKSGAAARWISASNGT